MIQFVDRMLGGGKKKMMKKVEQGDQGATDKSSTEEDAVFEVFDRCSRKGIGGWSAEMTEAMLGMVDEQTERMLRMLRSGLPEEVGNDPELVVDEIRKILAGTKAERKRSARRERRALTNVKK